MACPITERSNILTKNIDKSNAEDIVKLLGQCDEQIFEGWHDHKTIKNADFLKQLDNIASLAANYVGQPRHGIILSGCGTSGRIGFLISCAFNQLAMEQQLEPCYNYICSGGDLGLLKSIENCEDQWLSGKECLIKAASNFDKVLFIGITCGLSAPFVGGQIEYCLENTNQFTPYLLGFNPPELARTSTIAGTKKVMKDIVMEMHNRGLLLNPILGPEAITGSSRMKGGSATKIILEMIFMKAHKIALNTDRPNFYTQAIDAYQVAMATTYHNCTMDIARLIETAGSGVRAGGRLLYVGWGTLGILSLVDASECVPTFGASYDDVCAFINGGYTTLRNISGDLADVTGSPNIDIQYFMNNECTTLCENDTVVFIFRKLTSEDQRLLREMIELVRGETSKIGFICTSIEHNEERRFKDLCENTRISDYVLINNYLVQLYEEHFQEFCGDNFLFQCLAEISTKLILNAVSTGAHILKGKIVQNYMIDLKLSNRKLFDRAVSIVTRVGETSPELATRAIVWSIYGKENDELINGDISLHVQHATSLNCVIPRALKLLKETDVI